MKHNFLFLAIITLILILPLQQAQAEGLGDLISLGISKFVTGGIDIFMIQFVFLFQLLQIITGVLPFVAAELLKMVIALNGKIPLTPLGAADGDMVKVGFSFTRDLANMFFIIILAWVGFATILRLETYQVKKILPKLIGTALLINFIPVICGVIIDISDIITSYFLKNSSGAAELLVNKLPAAEIVRKGWDGLELIIPGNGGITGIAVKSLMGTVFNIVAFLMLLVYALIFIIRIVAIWILIVLAPLAWVGSIIPNGKKWWDTWWKQFIQWAIIGVFLTFFLYLSGLVLGQTSIETSCPSADFNRYGWTTELLAAIAGPFLCNTLPFIAGIIIMFIGFLFSITFAPTGADAVLKGAKKGGFVAGKIVGTTAAKSGWKMAKSPIEAFKSGRQSWKIDRGLGRDWKRSLSGALERAGAAVRVETTGELRPGAMAKSVAKGTWKTIKGAAMAGGTAGLGIKQKKKGKKECPNCHRQIAANAKTCPNADCGYSFE